jgi:RNA polymerase sigma factor (TIGR02999 family)
MGGGQSVLLALLYDELRQMAARQMAVETGTQTLQPNRAHFFAAAAGAMRRILIENARRKRAARHGGGQHRVDIQAVEIACPTKEDELLAVDEVLERFALEDPQKAELVKLRYFVGVTLEEAAGILDISVPTAKRWWTFARAWLFHEISTTQPK